MAAAGAASSCTTLLSRTSKIDGELQQQMTVAGTVAARSCCFRHMPCHPRPFQSSALTARLPSRGMVVRAGEPRRASLASSSPSASVPPLQAVPTQAITDRAAPVTSFEKSAPGSVVEPNGRSKPDIYKDKGKEAEEIKQWIEEIRAMMGSMTDGEITNSPYDTAWVALVPALDGSDGPQFPKSLQWIIENQFSDGSWGDRGYFSYYDRVCNTLACIIALKTWKTGSAAVEKGVEFIQKNLQAMETEEDAHMMIGFEIVFPALISYAKSLDLDLPFDAPIIAKISAEREKKLAKIPMDILHKVPTTLLHSLEGFHEELDWEKLLKLQSEDGSFLCSPASTAACLLHTKDEKALSYLTSLLDRFNNAVPNVYPVDLFEHMWTVDRLQRLGIDRYFEKEIKDSLDYVYKYYKSVGIGWARGSVVQDLDDTAMGFRLLRQNGYDVNEDVFRQFKGKESEFFCFAGQSGQAVTGLFNFYRATQTRFPGESLLATGEHFARGFLVERHEKNECFDKWIITKDLPGEVEYALATPWYCSLPRLETESYLSHYGTDDIWIGKSLYRMPFVNNETFLALAKADFNLCQAKHQEDLQNITRWSEDCGFGKLSFARQKAIEGVFSAACILPGPELSPARLVWAQNCVLTTVVDDYFDVGGTLPDMRRFLEAFKEWNPSLMDGTAEEAQIVFNGLYNTLNAMTQEGTLAQGRDIGQHLQKIWLRWLESCLTEAEWTASSFSPSFDEYMKNALPSIALEPIVLCTLFFLGEPLSDEFVGDSQKLRLMELTNRVGRLLNDSQGWKREDSQNKPNSVSILLRENPGWTEEEAIANVRSTVEESMLELVRAVHQRSPIPNSIRQLHFNMARIMHLFYQKTDGFTDRSAMAKKLKKVLFQPVV
uniref:Ent-kaurene synthase n=1 Tax=Liochlaena subulata TaxID=463575 RepID=E3WDE2_9MARC|nr:ent-kaurene synthase [Liochlaena subulata]